MVLPCSLYGKHIFGCSQCFLSVKVHRAENGSEADTMKY